jgi:hypothetical protein
MLIYRFLVGSTALDPEDGRRCWVSDRDFPSDLLGQWRKESPMKNRQAHSKLILDPESQGEQERRCVITVGITDGEKRNQIGSITQCQSNKSLSFVEDNKVLSHGIHHNKD